MTDIVDWHSISTIVFDFDGVFTDNCLWLSEHGVESVMCSRSDGLGLSMLKKFSALHQWDLDIFILSTEENTVVTARANKLKLKVFQGISNKFEFLTNYANDKVGSDQVPSPEAFWSKMLYVGNDLNDLKVMLSAGFTSCPGDSHPIIKSVSDIVLQERGGRGFVRSLIEGILRVEQMDFDTLQSYL